MFQNGITSCNVTTRIVSKTFSGPFSGPLKFILQFYVIFLTLHAYFPQNSSGFVFAAMSVMARFTVGALVLVIQKLFPEGR